MLMVGNSFMAHPDTLLPMTKIEDPVQRFVAVVRFYLSGWHIKPPYALPDYNIPVFIAKKNTGVSRSHSIQFWAKSSPATGIIQTIPRGITSQNRHHTILLSRATSLWHQNTA
jgi:hypothetical protein